MPTKHTTEGSRTDPAEAVIHWNYGPASRKPKVPADDTRYDPAWYKQHREMKPGKRGLLNKAINAFCNFIGHHRASKP